MSELVLYSSSVSSLHPMGPLYKNIKHKTAQRSDLGKQGEFCTKNDAKPLITELNRSQSKGPAAARTYGVILVVQKLWLETPHPRAGRVAVELGEGGTAEPSTPSLPPKAVEITRHSCRLTCRRKV